MMSNEYLRNLKKEEENNSIKLFNISSNQFFKIFSKLKGYLLVLLGNFVLTIVFFIFKHYTNERSIDPVTLICYRGCFITLYSGILILIKFRNLKKFDVNHFGSLFFRASINGFGMLMVIYALKNLRLSTCQLILRIGNAMSVFMGYLILNEKVSIYDIYGLISTILGVILILKPSFIFGDSTTAGEDSLNGIILAFICAFFISWGMVMTKKLLESFDIIFTILAMGILGCITGTIYSQIIAVDITLSLFDLAGVACTIFLEFIGVLLNYSALNYEPIVKLAPFYNSSIIYSVLLVYFFSGAIDMFDIIGVIIIVSTYIYISFQKMKTINTILKQNE